MSETTSSEPTADPAPGAPGAAGRAPAPETLLRQGRLDEAARAAESRLAQVPEDPAVLYVLAVCRRYQKRTDDARAVLARLLELAPAHARAWQEIGHLERATGHVEAAIDAYGKAVEHNPALVASWHALAALRSRAGDREGGAAARAQAESLAALPAELLSVTSMIFEGRLARAEALCRRFLKQHPDHVEGMRLLARIGTEHHVLDDAEFLLESAVAFQPDYRAARFDYLNVLHKRQKFEQAREQARILRETAPGTPTYEIAYANECLAIGEVDRALGVYDAVAREAPQHPQVHLLRGHALKTIGRTDDAVAAYRAAYAARADFGDAWWSLANLKTYRFTADEIAAMAAALDAPATGLEDRIHLAFALAKALEDREDYAEAFRRYAEGNELKRRQTRFRPERLSRELALQREHVTRDLFARHRATGCPAPDPIFIVGLPRAGSTLIEQILASHPAVEGTAELPNVLATAHRLGGRRMIDEEARYPANLHDLAPAELTALGERYLEGTRVYRSTGTPRFTDKMPNNFRHVGLIHLMLPNAKIIDARRGALACCFSGFRQLFAEGQEFSYGLADIGRYYRDYVALMDHWDAVLPGRVLRVQHEALVDDLEGQVRRMLDYLELPFDPACLEFHRTERAIRTPSAEQVRRPIYRSGLEHWRHFDPWLGPLREALGPLADPVPTGPAAGSAR